MLPVQLERQLSARELQGRAAAAVEAVEVVPTTDAGLGGVSLNFAKHPRPNDGDGDRRYISAARVRS